MNLRTKISLSLLFVSMILIIVISLFANLFLEKQFRQYIIEKQENTNKEITSLIGQQYIKDNQWNSDAIQTIGVNALEQGLIVKVFDKSGKTIWDAEKHNSGMCSQMIQHMSSNMASRYGKWEGKYTEVEYPINSLLNNVGTVKIGFYGPFYFNDHDLAFINTLNKALMGVALFAIIFSFIIGAILARRISNPIERVIDAAKNIAKGNFKVRSEEKSHTKEISELTSSINHLASTLQSQETLRKQMTQDVAHELRTPMTILQSHIEAMMDGIWEPTVERLKSCHEEIIRINSMIGDLNKVAKYESEHLVLSKAEFDILELISNVVTNFESQFKNKNISLKYAGDSVTINADKDTIMQVLINLVSNALKHTVSGGTVEISSKRLEDSVQIVVEDNGEGIPEEELPHIFERFYRVDKSRNKATGGVGIGLTISKSIVNAHGGTIEVESKVNKGTRFIVRLPR